MKSYVIFDLDGTLLNTIDDLANATNYAMQKLGFPTHGLWVYPNMVGNGVTRLVERALPDDARTEKNIADALAAFKEYYGEHCCDALLSRRTNIRRLSRKSLPIISRKPISRPSSAIPTVCRASRILRLSSRPCPCVPHPRLRCFMWAIPGWVWTHMPSILSARPRRFSTSL